MPSDFLTDLRDYLVTQGFARKPTTPEVDPNNPLPVIWNEPREGTPAPGQGKNQTARGVDAVVGLFWTPGVPPAPYEGFLRTNSVTFWIRTSNAPKAHALEAQLRTLLNDKHAWQMTNTPVSESNMFRDLTPVSFNEQGYTGNVEYLFTIWS